jgi:hypothetical protein
MSKKIELVCRNGVIESIYTDDFDYSILGPVTVRRNSNIDPVTIPSLTETGEHSNTEAGREYLRLRTELASCGEPRFMVIWMEPFNELITPFEFFDEEGQPFTRKRDSVAYEIRQLKRNGLGLPSK